MGEALASYLQTVGIKSHIRTMERATLTTAWREKKLKGLIVGITGAGGNAATRLEAYVSKEGVYTAGVIPEVEDLFQRQARETDVKRREALIHQIQQILHDRVTHVPIYELAFTWGHRPAARRARDQPHQGLCVLGAVRGDEAEATLELQEILERGEDGVGVVLVQRVHGARDLDEAAARQLSAIRSATSRSRMALLLAAQHQRRRRDGPEHRPPVDVELASAAP